MSAEETEPLVHQSNSDVADHYDRISNYIYFLNKVQHLTRDSDFTFHRPLSPNRAGNDSSGLSPTSYLHEVILSAAQFPMYPHILDAGCGFGGTIFQLHSRIGGTYDGITLSRVQVQRARKEARRRGIAADCNFHLRSYDDPLPQTYDGIIAVESLIHSLDLSYSIGNLAQALNQNGKLVIVEDMLMTDRDSVDKDHDIALLKNHWKIKRIPSVAMYRLLIAEQGLTLTEVADLSSEVILPNPHFVNLFERLLFAFEKVAWAGLESIIAFHIGSIALHRLYRRKSMGYHLLIAQQQ